MTAEIAILNKTAVALAADSAITLGSQKIYNSGNKLFALSKYRPIGIMVFGNAEFMGIPWETIIKFYRSKFKGNKFDKLIDYGQDFITFLENENEVFWPPDVQSKYFNEIVLSYFQVIVQEINEHVQAELLQNKLSDEQIANLVSTVIETHYKNWQTKPDLFNECDVFINKVCDNYQDLIDQAKADVFQKLPISNESSIQLTQISTMIFFKDWFSNSFTGIVVAGFGEKEIFPSAVEYQLETVVSGKLKRKIGRYFQANREQNAIIMPFAQQEMVNTFVEGIDPSYKGTLYSYYNELLQKYPENILSIIPDLSEDRKQELLPKINPVAKDVLIEFNKKIDEYTHTHHIDPVLQAVYALPKDELASMAESLVNLTSFKRRVSLQAETVGGPIDVAVISKGDGFIWIKRKHYFKPELNQAFFSNYYREEFDNKEGENYE
jgi:hypothetical protein